MRYRLIIPAALILSAVLGFLTPYATATWTPITPQPAGCSDDGFKVRPVDSDTIRVVIPIIADWQLGTFRINGVDRKWVVTSQVQNDPWCIAYSAVIRNVPWDGSHYIKYRWFDINGHWLEYGRKKVAL